jgi:hypothetical protein
MHILLIIFGAILALFGGGCTLILGGAMLFGGNPIRDLQDMGVFMFMLGILPLAAGYFMLRTGIRIDRDKRRAAAMSKENMKP